MSSISQKTKEILEINQPTWVLREKIASVNADLKCVTYSQFIRVLYNLVFAGQKFVTFYQEKFCCLTKQLNKILNELKENDCIYHEPNFTKFDCFNLHPHETKIKVEKHLASLVNGFPHEGVNSKIEETRKSFEQEFIEEASQTSKKAPSSNAEKYFEEIMMKMRQIEDIKRKGSHDKNQTLFEIFSKFDWITSQNRLQNLLYFNETFNSIYETAQKFKAQLNNFLLYKEKEEKKLSNLNELPSPSFPVHCHAFSLSSHGEDPPYLQKAASMNIIKTPEKMSPIHHTPSSDKKISSPNIHYDQGAFILQDLKLVKHKNACDCKKSISSLENEGKRTIMERTHTEINLKGDSALKGDSVVMDRNCVGCTIF